MISQIEPINFINLLEKGTNNAIYSNLTDCSSGE
jgi:hypothetical protein